MLLDDVKRELRVRHYSRRTEESYVGWICRFILFNSKRHPRDMAEPEVEEFLANLAVEKHVSASTQNQAACALLFLYKDVLKVEDLTSGFTRRAQRPTRLPVVLTRSEVRALLDQMTGPPRLVAELLYGAGLRLLECLTTRVKDVDFTRNEILVRDGKGLKGPPDDASRSKKGAPFVQLASQEAHPSVSEFGYRKQFGRGRWRKPKGAATVRLSNGLGWTSGATLVRSAWRRSPEIQFPKIGHESN